MKADTSRLLFPFRLIIRSNRRPFASTMSFIIQMSTPMAACAYQFLHPPGDDPVSGEKAEERWNPTQSVESILMSIISLLADPNCSSPANVDAGVAYRKDRAGYNAVVRVQVEASKKDIPSGFQMPRTEQDFMVARPTDVQEDADFWYDSENSDEDENLAEEDEGSQEDDAMDDEDFDESSDDE